EEFNFSEGFTDLHTKSYKSILTGEGFGLKDARQSIEIAHKIRNNYVESTQEYQHPILTSINK
ncbi:MAG: oxidoreductase, partial [Ignavibacteriae bacterium]|nr:oxidoreductase [Ignavibacteriota bacterium]